MSNLTFAQLHEAVVARTEEVFHKVHDWTPTDWACAMAGECGEACNAVKKIRRLETNTNTAKDPQTLEEATVAVADELADTIIYANLLAARLGIDLGQAVVRKFNLVSLRMSATVYLPED